jgi:hypothetical protein
MSLGTFMGLQKDITDQFYEVIVIIIGEEILRLNDHKSGDGSKEDHLCVLIHRIF